MSRLVLVTVLLSGCATPPASAGLVPSWSGGREVERARPTPGAPSTPSAFPRVGRPTPSRPPARKATPTRASVSAIRGTASWYDVGAGFYAAAGPALRVGDWRGRLVRVCAAVCIALRLSDWCQCPQRVIDLSRDAFARLAAPSRGVLTVRVSW